MGSVWVKSKKVSGKYALEFYDAEGNRKMKTLPKGTTKKEAQRQAMILQAEIDGGVWKPIDEISTFREVGREWIEFKKPNIRSSTWSVYEGHLRNHFTELNDMKISRITTAVIEKWINQRQIDGMNINTIRKILVTLNQVFKYAVRHHHIMQNPLVNAERPRGHSEKKMYVPTPEEVKALLAETLHPKYRMLFHLAAASGARQGELLGLKWPDVDYRMNQIHIRRTFNNGHFFQPKTKTSERAVDIGRATMKALKEWQLASDPNDFHLVFANEAGNPISRSNLRNRWFNPSRKNAGISSKMRFHDLRHFFASQLLENGENIKYIQLQMGHSSPTMTLNIYSHLLKPNNQKAANRLESSFL